MSASGAVPAPRPEPDEDPRVTAPLLHLLCHDFRVPLTTLSAYAELLRSTDLTADQRRQFVEAIESQSHRLARMIDDLEALALPPGPPPVPEESCADAEPFIRAAIAEVRLSAATRAVRILFEPGPVPLPARVRPDQLRRALAWLLEVALRRSAADGTITVWGRRDDHETRVGVDTWMEGVREADVTALRGFDPGSHPPDLVRGVAGPLWAALHGLERAGVGQEISRIPAGLRWVLVFPVD